VRRALAAFRSRKAKEKRRGLAALHTLRDFNHDHRLLAPQNPLASEHFKVASYISIPLALEYEAGPVIWRCPSRLPPHRNLRLSERRRRRRLVDQHVSIEPFHQFGRGFISDIPQARYYARSPGVHKPPRQSGQTFAFNLLAERGAAGREHDQFCVEFQVVNLVRAQKPLLGAACFVHKGDRLLSFWSLTRTRDWLRCRCEEKGVRMTFVSPYKTSQRCHSCGKIDSRNRKGKDSDA